jgi:hypothetical protein
MWNYIYFKTLEEAEKWIRENNNKYQMEIIFVQDAYGVEYTKLRTISA